MLKSDVSGEIFPSYQQLEEFQIFYIYEFIQTFAMAADRKVYAFKSSNFNITNEFKNLKLYNSNSS